MKIGKWIKKWEVPGSGEKPWIVSLSDQGVYGCSCPRWRFKRIVCDHIEDVQAGAYPPVGEPERSKPEYVLVHGCQPIERDGKLLIPLVAFGDTHMEATICYAMLKSGYSFSEVKERRHLPKQWSAKAITEYIASHGLAWRRCCDKYPHK